MTLDIYFSSRKITVNSILRIYIKKVQFHSRIQNSIRTQCIVGYSNGITMCTVVYWQNSLTNVAGLLGTPYKLCILIVVYYSENSLGQFTPLTLPEITELQELRWG